MSLQPVPIQNVPGVPDYTCTAFLPKSSDYCLLIPVINEGSRILTELGRAQKAGVDRLVDIVICAPKMRASTKSVISSSATAAPPMAA